jgi:hypothetical protein
MTTEKLPPLPPGWPKETKKIPPPPAGFSRSVTGYLGQKFSVTVQGILIEVPRDPMDVTSIAHHVLEGTLSSRIFGYTHKWLAEMAERGEIESNRGSIYGARYWIKK